MGPQSTGLILGRKDLIAACAANGPPFAAVGRPMKVSREEIIAFLKALELYLGRDHVADHARWEGQVREMEELLSDVPHITLSRVANSSAYRLTVNVRYR